MRWVSARYHFWRVARAHRVLWCRLRRQHRRELLGWGNEIAIGGWVNLQCHACRTNRVELW